MYEIPAGVSAPTVAAVRAQLEPCGFDLVWGKLGAANPFVRGQGIGVVDPYDNNKLVRRYVVVKSGTEETARLTTVYPWHRDEAHAIETFEYRVLCVNWEREFRA